MKLSTMVALAAAGVAVSVSTAQADEVDYWNNYLKQTIREVGGGPCPMSRANAMVNVAMFEAMNSRGDGYVSYLGQDFSATSNMNLNAAAATAAAHAMAAAYPTRAAEIMGKLNERLSFIAPGASKANGMAAGLAAANAVVGLRSADGSDANVPYVPGGNPGDWEPTAPDFSPNPHAPHWGSVTPWTMTGPEQFDPAPIPALNSQEYADAYNQVKDYGSKDSVLRTQDQKELAFFWANDINGTYKPPGHLNNITDEVLGQIGVSNPVEKARVYALTNLAMADAAITAWHAKYEEDLWRPITGIREGDTDGNDQTVGDPDWEPLNPFTPTFPAYTSGHATFGAAHGAVMAALFGDNTSFTITSEDPFYADLIANEGASVTRSFTSFSQAAWENAISRIYLGVHWLFDGTEGNRTGWELGTYVAANFYQAVPAPGVGAVMFGGVLLAARRRR